eukprot:m.31750 g.31750  ORF g.31750 m.31750 type:complete len:1220 (+) comp9341_c0_seq1:289-3948(+)
MNLPIKLLAMLALAVHVRGVSASLFPTESSNSWVTMPANIALPAPRGFHTAITLTTPCRAPLMVVFGGLSELDAGTSFAFLNDTWFFDLDLVQWYPLADLLHPETFIPSPSARAGHTAVRLQSNRALIFGGQNTQAIFNDTWIFTLDQPASCSSQHVLGTWSQIFPTCGGLTNTDCPLERWGHVAAFLNMSKSMYVFGGANEQWLAASLSSLSLSDAGVWRLTELTPNNFGWSRVIVDVPNGAPLARIGALFDAVSDQSLLIVSGFDGSLGALSDAWLLTLTTADGTHARWDQLTPIVKFDMVMNGSPFTSIGSAVSMNTGTLTTVGGTSNPTGALNNANTFIQVNASVFLWLINVQNKSVTVELKPLSKYVGAPRAIIGNSLVMYMGTIYVFGGVDPCGSICVNEMWTQPASDEACLQVSQAPWVQLNPPVPPTENEFVGLNVLNNENLVYLLGGIAKQFPASINPPLWSFSLLLGNWRRLWYNISYAPLTRFAHAQVTLNNSLVIFGGGYSTPDGVRVCLNDLWMWTPINELGDGAWRMIFANGTTSGPSPRMDHAYAVFDNATKLYIHGGSTPRTLSQPEQMLNDLWVFDSLTHKWTFITSGPYLSSHNAWVFQNTLYLFFGHRSTNGSTPRHNKTFQEPIALRFDNTTQRFLALPTPTPAPVPRAFAAFAVLSDLGSCQFYGGEGEDGNLDDFWIFNATTDEWLRIEIGSSLAQHGAKMIFLPRSSHLVVIGGSLNSANTVSVVLIGCNPGQYSPDYATMPCTMCPVGTYSALPGATTGCESQCPSSLSTPTVGSVSILNCTVCAPGVCNGHGDCQVLAGSDKQGSTVGNFRCVCSGWYKYSEYNNCNTPVVAVIVLSVLGLAAIIAIAARFHRKSKQHKLKLFKDMELRERLIIDQNEELNAYERVWEIPYDDLTQGIFLDDGSFGDVYRGQYNDHEVAIKILKKTWVEGEMFEMGNFKQEIRTLSFLRHKHILLFYGGGVTDKGVPFIVVEFMDRGSLDKILYDENISNAALPLTKRIKFLLDCADGMRFLHNRKVPLVHHDLKSANLLVNEKWVVKVSDFGTATLQGQRTPITTVQVAQKRSLLKMLGLTRHSEEQEEKEEEVSYTLEWAAPEVLARQPCNEMVDVYSFGIIMWEVAARKRPYEHMGQIETHALENHVKAGGRPSMEGLVMPRQYIKLMKDCWSPYSTGRPPFVECIPLLERIPVASNESAL